MSETTVEVANPVVIPYEKLIAGEDLSNEIEEAFGYNGLGLLLVSGIPEFTKLRKELLPLGTKLASLPEEVKEKYVHKESGFNVGWSHGKEKLKEGEFDLYKGSFYANPQYDDPSCGNEEIKKKYPHDYYNNIWPTEDLPELESAFKNLGRLMVSVGELIARQCDRYAKKKLENYEDGLLENIIKTSTLAKGRLLHYFPISTEGERARDSWCGWHNDHSCLTALCSAYYMDVDNPTEEINCPDPDAGLYARTRSGKEVKIRIPRDHLAFQIGESSQILTGGVLRATPHAVQALKYPESKKICRDTFAIFMQPNHDRLMNPPDGVDDKDVAVGQWKRGMTYGEFSKATVDYYYRDSFD